MIHVKCLYKSVLVVYFILGIPISYSGWLLQAQQDYSLKSYTVDNGLPHNQIIDIKQDKTGFLWIATWDGLSRFDGYEFKNYYHHPEDTTSFLNFIIEKLFIDNANHVLLDCGDRPISVYNRIKDNFEILELKGTAEYKQFDFNQDYDGKIWAVTPEFIYQLNDSLKIHRTIRMVDSENRKFKLYGNPQLAIDNSNSPWIFVNNGRESMSPFRGFWVNDTLIRWQVLNPMPVNQYPSSAIHNNDGNFSVYKSGSGTIFLFSKYTLFSLDTTINQFVEFKSVVNPTEFSLKSSFFWGNDETGINYVDTRIKENGTIKQSLNTYAGTAFMDNSGIIWSGTVSESRDQLGLNRYIRTPRYFRHYLTGKNEKGETNLVFPIVKDKNGDIWAGIRDPNTIRRISPDGKEVNINFTKDLEEPVRSVARIMTVDEEGIWIGSNGGCLFHYDFSTKKFNDNINTPPWFISKSFTQSSFHNILSIDDNLYINSHDEILKFNKKSGVWSSQYVHMDPGTAHCFMPDGDKGFWIGRWNSTIEHLDTNYAAINYKLGTEQTLVEHLCLGDSNDIWAALMGGGLGHFFPKTGKTEFFTTADGLTNNVIYSILKDKRGNLWMSTNHGISMFNPSSGYFRRFNEEEGLLIEEFNSDSWFQSKEGEMFFGGVGGFVSFFPDSILLNEAAESPVPLIITNLKVSGMPRYFAKAIYDLDTVVLQKGDNNFQVSFALLDFVHAARIRYRYRLPEENARWTETGFQDRNISFANLTHRDYRLEIEATDKGGAWSFSRSIVVRIPPKIHETLGFRILVILLSIGIIAAIVNLYLRQLKLKSKQLQDELRLESLRGQMNPHFIFNSLNSINYFISKNDKLSANHFIADFSRLIRSILGNLSSNFIPFEKEIESLGDYLRLEHLRFGDRFNYSLETESIENPEQILITPGMVQPFIENAIWHGVRGLEDRIGFIRIAFTASKPDVLLCTVEDDGMGRKQSEQFKSEMPGKKSQGIGIVLERLKIINNARRSNYQVIIEDLFPGRLETGTRVTISLPIITENQ